MAAGEPGQVVVGRATWEALGADAAATALGPIRVKGKREPVEAWRLDARRFPGRAHRRRGLLRMVSAPDARTE